MNRTLTRMVLNPGHAICINPTRAKEDEGWIGGFPGEGIKYWEHSQAAAQIAGEDAPAVLVPSGGMTRAEAGRLAEGDCLKNLIAYENYFGFPDLQKRTVAETYARDSLENLIFGICQFRMVTGDYPAVITVVGWAFKQERFVLHQQAIRWNREFRYVGVNNPDEGKPLEKAVAGEQLKVEALREDPYLQAPEWAALRAKRNAFDQQAPYRDHLLELTRFFEHLETGKGLFTGPLPWD